MTLPKSGQNYIEWTRKQIGESGEAQAVVKAVGGNFEAVGVIERCVLVQFGLKRHHRLIDVGCGSGRLAVQLQDYLTGKYLGIDVVPELLQYAGKICTRPDWSFQIAPGLTIPEPDQSADFVSFFSVFTHLLHEDSYKYLRDALRVLRPGGKVIFSFIEFALADHWKFFEAALADGDPDKILTQFIEHNTIQVWADHLGVSAVETYGADKLQVNLDRAVRWDNGDQWTPGKVKAGQSIGILTK